MKSNVDAPSCLSAYALAIGWRAMLETPPRRLKSATPAGAEGRIARQTMVQAGTSSPPACAPPPLTGGCRTLELGAS
ncbi:MAG: hypothetical protein ABWZ80_04550, partial [Beijerinckiaceae bacterium]